MNSVTISFRTSLILVILGFLALMVFGRSKPAAKPAMATPIPNRPPTPPARPFAPPTRVRRTAEEIRADIEAESAARMAKGKEDAADVLEGMGIHVR